jgi:diadenosine tetraphosphatase ApaH/serine/threonine PP2A family protein phosphatase
MLLGFAMHVLIVSDIHSNLAALDAVIHDAGPFDSIWCLGDVIGYGPQPNECIERLRAFELVCLAGNHDLGIVGKVSLDEFSPDARAAALWTRERLVVPNREWLEGLRSVVTLGEHGITLVHASPRDPVWEYVISPGVAAHGLDAIDTPICLNGHTHVPIVYRKPTYGSGVAPERLIVNSPLNLKLDRMMINPGSVGQPRDDDVRAAYALVDLETMTLIHRRVLYDIAATQKLMKQARLPDRLSRRLRFGE